MQEIDLVYLWVDGNDPVWKARHDACIGKSEEGVGVNCKGRFADNDELKYSLRSVEMYAPWIRHIFIVTDSQVPAWLDVSNPKVSIVDHKDIMPEQALPCFNSRVIEHHLANIPGLSERFIYANDDMMLNKPVDPDVFFAADGFPIVRFNRRPFRKLTLWFKEKVQRQRLSNYVLAIKHTAELVEKRYGRYFGGKTHHNMDAYLKSDCLRVREVFKPEIDAMLGNHERSASDVQRNVYSYVPIAEHRAHLQYVDRSTSFHLHIDNPEHFSKLDRYNPIFFCMNDSEYADDEDRMRAARFLSERFPKKSSFEIIDS